MVRIYKLIRLAAAYLRGMWEFRSDFTWADPARSEDQDYTDLDHAYDCGRDMAHALTFRRFDG